MSEARNPVDRGLSPIVRVAPAKVNLTLAVTGRTADGFHALHTVMVPLGLSDRLSLARAHGPTDTLAVTGLDAGPNEGNLVIRAIAAARAAVRGEVDAWPVAARLHKDIPVAAGLGGGSSDAAATLDAVFTAWGADTAVDAPVLAGIRAELAARLGSDVPFFLVDGPAIVTGRGETVQPLPGLRGSAPGLLLVTPRIPAPTPAVFRAYDEDPDARPRDFRQHPARVPASRG